MGGSALNSERWTGVDRYLTNLLSPHDAALDAALESSAAAGLPAIQVSPVEGKLLHLLARAQRAGSILEVGTLGGYSAIWLARALPDGGRLVTLELEPAHAEVARRNLARAGLADRAQVRVGPALESMRQLAAEGRRFDFFFIDADKTGYPDYLEAALALSRPGSLIVADNVVRGGAVMDAESRDANVQGVRRFLERLAADPRVDATAIQTVSGKGYDGMAIALVITGR